MFYNCRIKTNIILTNKVITFILMIKASSRYIEIISKNKNPSTYYVTLYV